MHVWQEQDKTVFGYEQPGVMDLALSGIIKNCVFNAFLMQGEMKRASQPSTAGVGTTRISVMMEWEIKSNFRKVLDRHASCVEM